MKRNKLRAGLYVLGSAALAAGALLLAPPVIDRLSGLLYAPPVPPPLEEEDWGPELMKRERPEPNDPEAPADAPAEEEENHGEL